ncbi:MAG: uridine kinase, partial [Symbiobacterium thermophilum]|nr:uridine kinase [Symbiobacterium thermophilum]
MPVPRAVIAIAGGTGSGKTTIANYISAAFPDDVALLPHDAYYKDNRNLTYEERSQLNYDHPDAFDNDLFIAHLKALKAGQAVERPVYNFSTHLREHQTLRVEPAAIIVVEGVLVLAHPELR